jgi:cell division protein ZapB
LANVGVDGQVTDSITEQLLKLEQNIDTLLSQCAHLREENRILRLSQENLTAERAVLLEKNELARSRVEAMIGRLKAMEQH